ncbi:hypothetical protein C8A00DRAFT_37669, partial [Chaetomidium leptoderma]
MELTSPLTTLASISTPESYYTAHNSPSDAADETTLSSPVEDHPPEEPGYRDAAQLPHELRSNCHILLEEQLYTAAIHILSGLLSDGTTNPSLLRHRQQKKPKPALIPPPSQIALLTTLIIHPSFTSRPSETSNLHAASHALAYLRSLLSTTGAVNANFRAAFDFTSTASSRAANGRTTSRHTSSSSSDDDDDDSSSSDALTGTFARSQLVFGGRAADFWAVLGWAFRCAAEYPHRWRYWRGWLGFVVGVLEADFDERLARDQLMGRGVGRGKSARPYPMLGGSLVVG